MKAPYRSLYREDHFFGGRPKTGPVVETAPRPAATQLVLAVSEQVQCQHVHESGGRCALEVVPGTAVCLQHTSKPASGLR